MNQLNIVLVEPQIPQNTGNIARTCAATGAKLHIVKPTAFEINDKNVKRAGLDYWYLVDIYYYDNIKDFFSKNKGDMFFFTTKAKQIYSNANYSDDCYLIFGREDAGLKEELLLEHPDSCVRIPMIDSARSLNLSNAVAIATYEVLRQWDFPELLTSGNLTKYNWGD